MNKEVKVRARPAAITLTSAAQDRITELMSRAPEGTIGVKLSTPRRGCSGLAYSVDYVSEENTLDEKIETPGGTFYGLARGRFRGGVRLQKSECDRFLRLRRELHRLIGDPSARKRLRRHRRS
jgi:hypothetical protein